MYKASLRIISLVGTLAALLMVGLAGCGGDSDNTNSSGLTTPTLSILNGSGVKGNVHRVPSSPNSTQTTPLAGVTVSAQPQGGGPEVAHAVTDSSGNYQIALVPGSYSIVPEPVSQTLAPVTGGQNVTIKLKQVVEVDFSYFNPTSTH